MKKLTILFILLILLMPIASAETTINAGITPDNPLWNLEIFGERMRLLFEINKEKKIELATQYAEERLAEIQKMEIRAKTLNLDNRTYTRAIEKARIQRQECLKTAEKEATNEHLRVMLQNRIKEQEQNHNETIKVMIQNKEKIKEIINDSTGGKKWGES